MVLNIFALLLVLGITFMHSLFGLFSGLINVVCCVAAMVVAFGFFDALNEFASGQGLHPSYTLPICFVLLFFLTHLVLRLAADNLIRGNVRIPMYVDWAGAGVCGFIIAQITVGVLVLGFLMLPWGGAVKAGGGRVMMFAREQRMKKLDRDTGHAVFKHNSVAWFLRPDEFTVGLFNLLGEGSLRGKTTLASVYPDFPQWVFWTGNTVQHESATSPFRDESGDGFGQEGLRLVSWWEHRGPLEVRYRPRLPFRTFQQFNKFGNVTYRPDQAAGKYLLGMRLELNRASADRDKTTPHHRFRPTMIRVVGELNGQPRDYIARLLGGAESESDQWRLADIDNNFAIAAVDETTELDVYFEVDEDFVPHFVEYRRHARAPVTGAPAETAPPDRLVGASMSVGERMVGAARFINAIIPEGTGDTTELPFALARSALGDVELSGGKFVSGRIAGPVARLRGTSLTGAIKGFAVPEGKRLFQLRCNARRARSLAGRVFNYAGSVLNTYRAYDRGRQEYRLAGYYAIVQRDGEDYFELYLVGELDAAAFRGGLDFKSIRNNELRGRDSIIGLLFFVNPGSRITRVENQSRQGVEFPNRGYQMGE